MISFDMDDYKARARLMDECLTCKCGSNLFYVLKSYQLECSKCGIIKEMPFSVKEEGETG